MRKFWIFLLILLLCGMQAAALELPDDLTQQSLEAVMADFMEENGLNEHNFSLSYCNTVTGERYAFNDKCFMVAASTFKLPLNMYFYEMERDGEIEPDAFISRAGVTLDVAHRESLVNSNNDFSIGMLYTLGDYRTYKELLREAYFTMDEAEIDDLYYVNNYFCTNMMMDALEYLYDHSGDFSEMLDYMKQAQPDEYFRAGVTEYEVAHKYGWYEGAVNDVGIIYTDEPFLLAVYTQGIYGEGVLADVAALLTAYNVANAVPPEPEEEELVLEVEMVPLEQEQPETAVTLPASTADETAAEPEAPETAPEMAFVWWMPVVALGVFLLGGGGTLLIFHNKHLRKIAQEERRPEEEGN